jgi:hypothetical protein
MRSHSLLAGLASAGVLVFFSTTVEAQQCVGGA